MKGISQEHVQPDLFQFLDSRLGMALVYPVLSQSHTAQLSVLCDFKNVDGLVRQRILGQIDCGHLAVQTALQQPNQTIVSELVAYKLQCLDSGCGTQKLENGNNACVSQLSIGKVYALRPVMAQILNYLFKFLRDLDLLLLSGLPVAH